jgi:hypothetical protein
MRGIIKPESKVIVEPVGLYGYDARKSMSPRKDKSSPNKSPSP